MATATILPTDTKDLERELQQELQQFETVQRKLDQDNQKLQAARTERARLVAAVGHGNGKESDVTRAEEQIHNITIRIEGLAPILTQHRARIDELHAEIHRRQADAAKAAREKEYADLKEHGAALAKKIQDLLVQLCIEDLPAFDALRRRLAFEFADLDGYAAAVSLVELFVKHSGPSERLRNPEVHLARLEARGFGYESPFQRSPAEPKQFPLQFAGA